MDGARNTVIELIVDLGDNEISIMLNRLDVILGGCIDDVPHGELLDGLVLWCESETVVTGNWPGPASVLLASSVVTSLAWHL